MSATFHARSSFKEVLAQADARAVIEAIAPEILGSPLTLTDTDFPLQRVMGILIDAPDPRREQLLDALYAIENRTPRPAPEQPIVPNAEIEGPEVARGSAAIEIRGTLAAHDRIELELTGPSAGNPFVDVELTARFSANGESIEVGGFYDGAGTYRIRFLPPSAGIWSFVTTSTARSLDGVTGKLEIGEATRPGPVRVIGDHFERPDGSVFVPVGTTAYAWTHQEESLQDETLASLATTAFTKLRMGLFPKHFIYNENEPERFVFERDGDGWDTTRFDVEYFRALERRIAALDELGIEADLILFHPYDRWGFSKLGATADDRYVRYVVRRLSAFRNVWWSLANEYDLLLEKTVDDWNRIGRLIRSEDPVGHPCSIHQWVDLWDYSTEWATHVSIQYGEQLNQQVRAWRWKWEKPVIIDEFGYEGDIDQGWGFLTSEEEVRRAWEITMAGGYATHGETFYREDDRVFWGKGGTLRGESPGRLAFLRRIVEESPIGRLEPLPSDFDAAHAGVAGRYHLIHFGAGRPAFRVVRLPEGMRATIDVIDTWNMTIEQLDGTFEDQVRVPLPARPYMAIRAREVSAEQA